MNYQSPADLPLLEALTQLCPQSSKNTLRAWIKEGRVEIDKIIIKNVSFKVLQGQQISIGQRRKILRSGLPILYEDQDLVVMDKPSGLLTVATAFAKGETLHAHLKAHYRSRRIFVVHRLDQDTSGALVFAFNEETRDRLKALFEAHDIERAYMALVEGKMESPSGTWRSYQYEDSQYVVHETTEETEGSRLAITHYRTMASSKRYSCLDLRLETGRKNQIRVHCQSAHHPVVGDKKYGAKTNPLHRLCLHAYLLAFQHPTTKKRMRFEAPIPEEFYRLIPAQNLRHPN